jgi:hypothetical protein
LLIDLYPLISQDQLRWSPRDQSIGLRLDQGPSLSLNHLTDRRHALWAFCDEQRAAYTGVGAEYEGVERRERMKRVREIKREIAILQRELNASMNDMPQPRPLPQAQ